MNKKNNADGGKSQKLPGNRRKDWRFFVFKVLILFGFVGPPIGAFFFGFFIGVYIAITEGFSSPDQIANILVVPFFTLMFGFIFSYPIGVVPSLLAGLVTAAIEIELGSISQWRTAQVGAVIGLVFAIFLIITDNFLHMNGGAITVLLFVFVCSASTWFTWRLVVILRHILPEGE